LASSHRYSWTRADGSTGKGWRAKWTGADGSPQSKRGFDRKGDAETYAADREAEARHGVTLEGERPSGKTTVEVWASTWLAGREVKPNTVTSYKASIARITAAFGGRSLSSLRPSELRTWRRTMEAKYQPTTVALTSTVFAMILRDAVHDGLLARSPMPSHRSRIGRVVDPERLLTLDQVRAWDAALPVHAQGMALVAATTGLRQGELLGLRVEDVDWLRRLARVSQQLQGQRYVQPKSKAGVREVPLTKVAADALAAHLAAYPAPAGEPIFRAMRGGRWNRKGFDDVWRKARKAARVEVAGEKVPLPEWATWHDLRDVAASALIYGGVDVRAVMSILGHGSAEETLRTYARMWPKAQDVSVRALDALWSEGAETSEGQGGATST
jgi:integrase